MRTLTILLVFFSLALAMVACNTSAPVPSVHAAGVVDDDGAPMQLPYIDDPETGVRCYYIKNEFLKYATLSCVTVRKGAEEILGAIALADAKRKQDEQHQ